MSRPVRHDAHVPLPAGEEAPVESAWFVSLLFWLALLVAAGLYAAVALAPRYLAWLELREEFYRNQVRLVALERQAAYLNSVVAALENDSQFAAELARIDFDASRPGEERIPVERHLSLDGRSADPAAAPLASSLPWYAPLVALAAQDHRLRRNVLIAAAVVVIVAFTFLHESQAPQIRAAARNVHGGAKAMSAGVQWLVSRYRTTQP